MSEYSARNFPRRFRFHPAFMNSNEEHYELWKLLGKARQPVISPFFSRNVLREVRALRQEKPGLIEGLRRRWRVAALATCGFALAAGAFFALPMAQQDGEEGQLLAFAESVSASPDYQVISHLDELLDSEENSVWLDGASTF